MSDDISGAYEQEDLVMQMEDLLAAEVVAAGLAVDDDDEDGEEDIMSSDEEEELGVGFLVGRPPPVFRSLPLLPPQAATTTTTTTNNNNNSGTNSTTQTTTLTRHVGVECDECGMVPIVGTRYKCVTRRNYDICRQCWQDNHLDANGNVVDSDDGMVFYAFDVRLSNHDSRELERPTARRSIVVYSLKLLADELNNDPTIEDVTFHPMSSNLHPHSREESQDRSGEMARKAIAEHKGIKTFHMNTHDCPLEFDTVTEYVVEGLRENQSVVSVGISIMALSEGRRFTSRDPSGSHTSSKKFSKSSIQAMKDLLVFNDTIQFLFIKRPYNPFHIRKKHQDDELLEDELFDGLMRSSSLQTFRYDYDRGGMAEKSLGLSDKNKKKAWYSMEHNPNLRRICCRFANDDDQYLDLLTTEKKHQWMKRWTTGSSKSAAAAICANKNDISNNQMEVAVEDQPQQQDDVNKERYNVLVEVLGQTQLDVVTILFRLIRNQPEYFMSLQQQQQQS